MIDRLKLQTKILLPLSLLIVVVLVLTANMLSTKYVEGRSLSELEEGVALATKISQLIHSTQKERGMSSGYLASKGRQFEKELLAQRKVTDEKAKELKRLLYHFKDEDIVFLLKKALTNIHTLEMVRRKIDQLDIQAEESIRFFSHMNDKLLNVIIAVSKTSKVPSITQQFTAYNNFLYAKENAGIERAVGTAILAAQENNEPLRVYFIELIATQKIYIKIFFSYASPNISNYYQSMCQGKAFHEVERIRKVILYEKAPYDVNAEYWFKNITYKINLLQYVNTYLEDEISGAIHHTIINTYRSLGILAFLNILSILSFVLMIILIIRLIRSEKRLKMITDKYIISSTTDTKGRILEVSDAFCTISGYTREELVGKPHNIIRHPDMPKQAFKEMWNTIQRGKSWRGKVKNLKKDGGYYWVYANIEPLFDRKNRIEGYAAIRLDITDSVHLEEELKRSKEKDETLLHQSKLAQMGEMISMIAHQWRQPLTAISSTANDMYMKIMLDQYTKQYFMHKLEKINEFSMHLSQTIDDFRNFYKKDKQEECVIYTEVVRGAFDIISTSLVNKNIELRSDFRAKKKISVLVNELRQVILNLMKNAEDVLLERKVDDPYILVKTYDDEVFSYLEVGDNGGGIPREIIHSVFDPYFSTKMKKDGTGLGLYMSKIIIEDHCHGTLSVANSTEGALFTIRIPIAEEKDEEEGKG
jgi:PAS domain S-box-containing protein